MKDERVDRRASMPAIDSFVYQSPDVGAEILSAPPPADVVVGLSARVQYESCTVLQAGGFGENLRTNTSW